LDEKNAQPGDQAIQRYRYTGPSMQPTLKPGQVLYTRPAARSLQPGDVVVYRDGTGFIVHRVTVVTSDGFIARGDNNPAADPGPIPFERVMGVVERADDWGKVSPVTGGRRGLWLVRIRWLLSGIFRIFLPAAGAPYRWLKRTRWVTRIWHPPVKQIRLHTGEGSLVKYTVNGKTVATWHPESKRFRCRRPYDLVIFPPQRPLKE
jgi:hypothetical protein